MLNERWLAEQMHRVATGQGLEQPPEGQLGLDCVALTDVVDSTVALWYRQPRGPVVWYYGEVHHGPARGVDLIALTQESIASTADRAEHARALQRIYVRASDCAARNY